MKKQQRLALAARFASIAARYRSAPPALPPISWLVSARPLTALGPQSRGVCANCGAVLGMRRVEVTYEAAGETYAELVCVSCWRLDVSFTLRRPTQEDRSAAE